jgi:hypothetical protein
MSKNRGERQSGQGKQGQGQDNKVQRGEPTPSNRQPQQPTGVKKVAEQRPNAQQSQMPASTAQRESQSEAVQSSSEKAVTNQDQQRQVTNSDGSNQPMREEETEGDRRDRAIEPYMTNDSDSGSTDHRSPTKK